MVAKNEGGAIMSRTIDDLEMDLFKARMEELFQKAYEKGVQDGMERFSYPPTLKNSDIAKIFQIADSTVVKLTANPSFPRLSKIKGRYPRDLVFEWINENSNWVKQNTNYFSKNVM